MPGMATDAADGEAAASSTAGQAEVLLPPVDDRATTRAACRHGAGRRRQVHGRAWTRSGSWRQGMDSAQESEIVLMAGMLKDRGAKP